MYNKASVLFFLLMAFAETSFGQIETFYVHPNNTDPNYATDQDSSTVSINSDIQENLLYIFLGGTGASSSSTYNALRLHAATLGFDVINLSYINDVPVANLRNDSDRAAMDNFREEICFWDSRK